MKTSTYDNFYFPRQLRQSLDVIVEKPLTLILAGSGFGKTTAVTSKLNHYSQNIKSHWYTCFGESPERVWEGICKLIAFVDKQIGNQLLKIEQPTIDNLGYIASLISDLDCEKETVLVVDNYQLANFLVPYRLLDALASHNCLRLHIVVLSHPIYDDVSLFLTNPRIAKVTQDIFCFSFEDVQKMFSRYGVDLNTEDVKK